MNKKTDVFFTSKQFNFVTELHTFECTGSRQKSLFIVFYNTVNDEFRCKLCTN